MRGEILKNFGWKWRYLHWGIRWHIVQKMLIDAPRYTPKKSNDGDKKEEPKKVIKPASFANIKELINGNKKT